MCLCGHKVTAPTVAEAWLLFDEHCDAAHGRIFPLGTLRKGELSMTPNAVKARRLKAEKEKRG